MGNWKPMLAAEGVVGEIAYPKVALPKLNGVRGLNQGGSMLARSLKPIPNEYIRRLFGLSTLDGLDGELVVGDFAHEEVFAISTSGVMTREGKPDVTWHAFDYYHATAPYLDRLVMVSERVKRVDHPKIEPVEFCIVHNDADMQAYADWALHSGYEGLVLRDPKARYKTGRSTAREGGFLRFCPWHRSEAIILAIHEGQVNLNESKRNELGYLKKSSHKENKVWSGQAGAFTVRDISTGLEFNMPVPGDEFQKEVWAFPDKWVGAMIKYKFKPAVKVGGKPRFPQYEGIRHPDDMS